MLRLKAFLICEICEPNCLAFTRTYSFKKSWPGFERLHFYRVLRGRLFGAARLQKVFDPAEFLSDPGKPGIRSLGPDVTD